MPIESINIAKKIARRITESDGDSIVVLFDNILPTLDIPSSSVISVNGFLKNLKGYSKITSTQAAPLPDISIEDSEPERRVKALDVEWNSQRKHLELLVSADGSSWVEVGAISLIKQQGYPYRMHSLLDFFTDGLADEFGSNGKVACRIVDVGYGLLSGNDVFTVHGSFLQEIVYKTETQPINISLTCNGSTNNGGGNSNGDDEEMSLTPITTFSSAGQVTYLSTDFNPSLQIEANANRKYLCIQNQSNYEIAVSNSSNDFEIFLSKNEKFECSKGGFYYTGQLTISALDVNSTQVRWFEG
ncbi:hypothetical protein NIES2101_23940 [Calothrix sp. HK-06]|nr:hypothetical protein NIES2101_23805 [Calothrix sp. HK-06]OKH47319.1 hypothetical protein NIES2101_23940 [Calothrix sp. HK-06]